MSKIIIRPCRKCGCGLVHANDLQRNPWLEKIASPAARWDLCKVCFGRQKRHGTFKGFRRFVWNSLNPHRDVPVIINREMVVKVDSTPCLRCRRPYLNTRLSNRPRPLGFWFPRRGVRGLCVNCSDVSRRDGTIHNYSKPFFDADDLLDEWVNLRDQGYSPRRAADRLGMKFQSFERALYRALERGDERGSRGQFFGYRGY